MKHEMNLQREPFEAISCGRKKYEMRLYDEKRQRITVGDEICFQCEGQRLTALVAGLHRFESFEALYRSIPLTQLGYSENEAEQASQEDMRRYYPAEEEQRYGVVAIELTLRETEAGERGGEKAL